MCAAASGHLAALELHPATHRVSTLAELVALEPLLAASEHADPELLTIQVAAGTYVLRDSVRIARSNVRLIGEEGARFVLAAGINEPVIAIGSQNERTTPADVISNIEVSGLAIDGNKDHQSSETSLARPWIRNNGIDVRAVQRLLVERVDASNNRSGGLVISWDSADVHVRDSSFDRNYFDGVAYYASVRVFTTGCSMRDNDAAGISLDNDFAESVFAECTLERNRSVGVFVRFARALEFRGCLVADSGDWAYFLAHDDHGRGVFDVTISGGRIAGNRGGVCMGSVDETQSSATSVIGAVFADNQRDGRANIHTAGSLVRTASIVELTPLGAHPADPRLVTAH